MQGVLHCQNMANTGGVNIYAQLQEPLKKDGIWIKTAETVIDDNKTLPEIAKYKVDNIELVNDFKTNFTKLEDTPVSNFPFASVAIGTKIYIFMTNNQLVYEYNTLTSKYTQLSNTPVSIRGNPVVVIGTDIFLFGSSDTGYQKYAYKYNTLTDEYTQLPDIPYKFYNGSVVSIGADIFLIGGAESKNYLYKFDTTTNTYTRLSGSIPYNFGSIGFALAKGVDIYLFGFSEGADYRKIVYRYNTLTEEYTRLTNIPYKNTIYSNRGILINKDIYLFCETIDSTVIYIYDTVADTYTELTHKEYLFKVATITAIDTNIYLYQGTNVYNYYIYALKNKTVYIKTIPKFKTKLTKKIEINFSEAKIYDDNELKDYPTYYGDGEKWNLIA